MNIQLTPEKIAKRIKNKTWDLTYIKNNITAFKKTLKLDNNTISDNDAALFIIYVIENKVPSYRSKKYFNRCRDFTMERYIEYLKDKCHNSTQRYFYLLYGVYGEEERKKIIERRGSPWCPKQYAEKHNVTIEEAAAHIKQTLNNKATSLAGFIKRHGQEKGTQKYNEWLSKCRQTPENFEKRYKEQAAAKWDNHIQNKRKANPRCIEYWTDKGYTQVQAKEQVSNFQINNAGVHLQYLLQTYDAKTAHSMYKQINLKKDASSFQYFLSKYGDTPLAYAKYQAACDKKDGVSIKSFLRRGFSQEEAQILHKQAVLKRIPNSYSQESKIFFEKLLKNFNFKPEQIFSGERERFIYDKLKHKYYMYDLTIITENIKCIIEYHGVAFHPSPSLTAEKFEAWKSPYSRESAHTIKLQDEEKKQLAINSGFKYYEVWSDDTEKLNKAIAFLTEIFI